MFSVTTSSLRPLFRFNHSMWKGCVTPILSTFKGLHSPHLSMIPVWPLLCAKILHERYELVRKRSLEHNHWPNASSALETERERERACMCERERKGIMRFAEAPPHWHRSMIHSTAHPKPANEALRVVAAAAASAYTIHLFSPSILACPLLSFMFLSA